MRRHLRFIKLKSIFVLAFISLIFWSTSIATGFYQVIDLGTNYAYAQGLNKYNQVVGYVKPNDSWPDAYAFFWSAESGFVSIGGYRANAINDSGQIAGCYRFLRAGVWENGSWIALSGRQEAVAINNSGQVTGLISSQGGSYAPFRDDDIHSPGFIELQKPYPEASQGFDINNKGQIAADCGRIPDEWEDKLYFGVFYDEYGNYTILNDGGNYASHARGINDLGQIVGNSRIREGSDYRAVFWNSPNSGMWYMGSLGSGYGEACAINDLGQAVGFSADKAFIWNQNGGMVNLNRLIDPGLGITLTRATDINNDGLITAWGIDSFGRKRSFLLIPEPTTLLLLGLGGLVLRRRR